MAEMVAVASEHSCTTVALHETAAAAATTQPNAKLRLYLVRHGESKANEEGVFAGQLDSPLTQQGIQDATALGRHSAWLRVGVVDHCAAPSKDAVTGEPAAVEDALSFDVVYSSDLVRAHDTGKCLLRGLYGANGDGHDARTSIVLDERLRERSYGTLQGMPWSSDRTETDRVWKETRNEPPPLWESDDDIWRRVREFLKELLERELPPHDHENDEASTKHVLMATHGGVLRQILLQWVGIEPLRRAGATFDPQRNHKLVTPNASLTILEVSRAEPQPLEENAPPGTASSDERGHQTDESDLWVELVVFADTQHLAQGHRIHDD